MTQYVQTREEILLGGNAFPILGPVRMNMASQWPGKVTTGDTGRDSDPIRSTMGLQDFTGGVGLERMEGAEDVNRVRWSTHDLRRAGHLRHLPRAYGPRYGRDGRDRLKGDTSTENYERQRVIRNHPNASAALLFTIEREVYCVFERQLRRWLGASQEWSGVLHTFPNFPTDVKTAKLENVGGLNDFELDAFSTAQDYYGAVYGLGLLYVGFEDYDSDGNNTDDSYRIQAFTRSGQRSLDDDRVVPYLANHEPHGLARFRSLATGTWEQTSVGRRATNRDSSGDALGFRVDREVTNRTVKVDLEILRNGAVGSQNRYISLTLQTRQTGIYFPNPLSVRFGYVSGEYIYLVIDRFNLILDSRTRDSAILGDYIDTAIWRFRPGTSFSISPTAGNPFKRLTSGFRGASVVLAGNTRWYRLSNGHLATESVATTAAPVDKGAMPAGAAGLVASADGAYLYTATPSAVMRYSTALDGPWEPVTQVQRTMSGISMYGVGDDDNEDALFIRATVAGESDIYRWTPGAFDSARQAVLWKNTAAADHQVRIYSSDNEEIPAERITVRRADVSDPESIAITEDNSRLYVAGSDGRLELYSLAEGATYGTRLGERSVAGSPHLRGMTIMGDHVFGAHVSGSSTTIYKVLLAGGTIADQLTLPNTAIRALANDGQRLYAYDSTNGKVLLLNESLQQTGRAGEYTLVAHGDGLSWSSDLTRWGVSDVPAQFVEPWNDQVWVLSADGQLRWSIDLDNWTIDARLTRSEGTPQALLAALDPRITADILYVATTVGLFAHLASERRFVATSVEFAWDSHNGTGTARREGSIYVPARGQALYHYNVAGQFATQEEIGPRNDAALPTEYASNEVVKVLPWERGLMIVLNPPERDDQDYENVGRLSGGGLGGMTSLRHPIQHELSAVLTYRNNGWSAIWVEAPLPNGTQPHVLDAIIHEAQLLVVMDSQMIVVDLERNPLELQSWNRIRYEEEAETITAWFDAGISDVQKVALTMLGEIEWLNVGGQAPLNEEGRITLSYGLNYNEGWTVLVDNWHAEESAPGLYGPLWFGGRLGLAFRAIRFRIQSVQGTFEGAEWSTPDFRGLTLEYYKRLGLTQRYEYTVTVDLSQEYAEKSQEELAADLIKIIETPLLTPFIYRGEDGWRTAYVKVLGASRIEWTGPHQENRRMTLVLSEI